MTRKLRRDILKQGGLALTGLASLTGLTSASSSDDNDDDFSETVTGSGIQDESKLPENLQSGRNHSTTDDKEISTDRENVDYVDHLDWETTLSAVGQDLADVENSITIREMIDDDEEPVTDSDGDYCYVAEYFVQSEEYDHLGHSGATTNLEMGSEYESSTVAEQRDPATTYSKNGEWVTIEASLSVAGTGASAAVDQWVDHGRIGPLYWTPGDGGEYGIEYDGDTSGGKDWEFMGVSEVRKPSRVDKIGEIIDSWEGYCRAYLKTI